MGITQTQTLLYNLHARFRPTDMVDSIRQAADFIRSQTSITPAIGIILGTGLNALANDINVEQQLPYDRIPHFPASTLTFQTGRLLLGTLGPTPVVVMQGRYHFYEGFSMQQLTLPIRVMRTLGIHTLLISNAAGGLNPNYALSDLMVIDDHISLLMPQNPLTGPHDVSFGDRFPDMSQPYDPVLIERAFGFADALGFGLQRGTYVYAPGPQLETKAEYRMLRQWGADAVGMSTVPEVIVAHQMGIRVFGISVITDLGIPETLQKAELSAILAAAAAAEPNLTRLIGALVQSVTAEPYV